MKQRILRMTLLEKITDKDGNTRLRSAEQAMTGTLVDVHPNKSALFLEAFEKLESDIEIGDSVI